MTPLDVILWALTAAGVIVLVGVASAVAIVFIKGVLKADGTPRERKPKS